MQNGPWPQPIRWSPKQSISLWQWQKEGAVSKIQVPLTKGKEPQQIQQEGLLVQVERRVKLIAKHKHNQKDLKELTRKSSTVLR